MEMLTSPSVARLWALSVVLLVSSLFSSSPTFQEYEMISWWYVIILCSYKIPPLTIEQKIPIIGGQFRKEIPASDNVRFGSPPPLYIQTTIALPNRSNLGNTFGPQNAV